MVAKLEILALSLSLHVCMSPISYDEAQTPLVDKEGCNVSSDPVNGITVVCMHFGHSQSPSTSWLIALLFPCPCSIHNAILKTTLVFLKGLSQFAFLSLLLHYCLFLTASMLLYKEQPQRPEPQPLPAALEEDRIEDGQLPEHGTTGYILTEQSSSVALLCMVEEWMLLLL